MKEPTMTKTDQSELSKKILGVFARYGIIAEKPGAAKALVELFSQHAGSDGGEHAENLAEVANWVENQGCPEEANQLRAAAARIAELEGVLREIAKEEDGGYGFYHGGDPRKFCPDAEGCTPKELADHKAACEKWDEAEAKGEKLEPEPDGSGWISPSVHVTRSAYGMGSYTYPTHAAVLASAALTPPTKEAE